MQENVHDWTDESSSASVTVEQLDSVVASYLEAREIYEAAKKVSSEKYSDYQALENKLVALLTQANKKSYKVDGLGTATRVLKNVVSVPKDLSAKRLLFSWIGEQYGKDVLDDMVSINHQKLNGWYNEEVEKNKDNPMFSIPGIEAPTSVESLSFRREARG
jgi:hypothetical protein